LHGGYRDINEYMNCRMFADACVQRIYEGTNEIMKELISRAIEHLSRGGDAGASSPDYFTDLHPNRAPHAGRIGYR
jgi:hypothetical protein